MVHTQSIRVVPANENGRGNLEGMEVSCSCGHTIRTSMYCDLGLLIHEHAEVMARKERLQ